MGVRRRRGEGRGRAFHVRKCMESCVVGSQSTIFTRAPTPLPPHAPVRDCGKDALHCVRNTLQSGHGGWAVDEPASEDTSRGDGMGQGSRPVLTDACRECAGIEVHYQVRRGAGMSSMRAAHAVKACARRERRHECCCSYERPMCACAFMCAPDRAQPHASPRLCAIILLCSARTHRLEIGANAAHQGGQEQAFWATQLWVSLHHLRQ